MFWNNRNLFILKIGLSYIHIWFITIFLFKRNKIKMDTMCWFCVECHMSVNLDAFVKTEARIIFIHLSWLFMDGDWKWFWSPEEWQPKKPRLPDCDNWESRLRWSKIFGRCKFLFFWWPNFWLPNTSHRINNASTSTVDLATKFFGCHFLQLNFFVTFFFPWRK